MSHDHLKVSKIITYPVKSCGGASLLRAHVDVSGVQHDRIWRVIFGDNDTLTQRDCAKMALVSTLIAPDAVTLSFPDAEPLRLSLTQSSSSRLVRLSETCDGLDEGDAVADWLSTKFGVNCRLMRVVPVRSFASVPAQKTYGERLFIGQPLLVISSASLEDLNSRLPTAVRMNRFRPNLVISGSVPYEENSWQRIRINGIEMAPVEGCGRCALILIDQETGERSGKEPLRELAKYRRNGKEVIFGHYFAPSAEGYLSVNDTVRVN